MSVFATAAAPPWQARLSDMNWGEAPFWNSEGSFIIHRPRGQLFEMKNYPVRVGDTEKSCPRLVQQKM